MNDIYDVIKKPRVSEKAAVLHETTGELVLEVAVKATKLEIKQAVEDLKKDVEEDEKETIMESISNEMDEYVEPIEEIADETN